MDVRSLMLGLAFAVMWSSAFTSGRIAMAEAPPFLFLAVRYALSGGIAVAVALALRQALPHGRWGAVIAFGLMQNVVYLGANFWAFRTIEAGLATIIAAQLPLTVAACLWLTGERLGALGLIGLAAGAAGTALMLTGRIGAGADIQGILACCLGLAALTAATLLVRSAGAGTGLLMVVGLQMLVSSLAFWPISALTESWEVTITPTLALAFLYTTFVPGLTATLVWFTLIARVGPTRAASFHFLNPFLGVAVAAVVIGETLTPLDWLAVAIITAGIVLVQRARA